MLTPTDIARVCHEANRAYCQTIGDTSQPVWEEAPEWQRDSAVKGVQAKLANPQMTAEEQHGSWLKDKLEDGWRYGAVKNPATKEHPCVMPYASLPADQRRKDLLFGGIVLALRN